MESNQRQCLSLCCLSVRYHKYHEQREKRTNTIWSMSVVRPAKSFASNDMRHMSGESSQSTRPMTRHRAFTIDDISKLHVRFISLIFLRNSAVISLELATVSNVLSFVISRQQRSTSTFPLFLHSSCINRRFSQSTSSSIWFVIG
jgi:hypothetical protein